MRKLLFAAAVLAVQPAAACPVETSPRHYVTMGTDAVATLAHIESAELQPYHVIDEVDGVAVVEVTDASLEMLSLVLHEERGTCGGYMVHESLAEAEAALHPPAAAPFEYTLDRAAAVREVVPKLDKERILGTIRELSAMQNRYYQSETGAAASIWIANRWRELAAARPDVTVRMVDHGWAQKSVVLRIPGTTKRDEVVVLGGHLDSINARGGNRNARAPGADDDASGIATLTETLRALLASDYRPERTIEFMAYAAEEVGLRGSQAIAREYQRDKVHVVGALQLDMTNFQGSDRDIWLMKDFTNAAQNDFVVKLIEAYTGATWGLDACGYACSDHASWYRTGVPASMPFESRFKQYNRSIHTVEDTVETCGSNANHAIKFARLAASYAIEMGKGGLGETGAPGRGGYGWTLLLANLALAGTALAMSRRTIR